MLNFRDAAACPQAMRPTPVDLDLFVEPFFDWNFKRFKQALHHAGIVAPIVDLFPRLSLDLLPVPR